MKKLIAGILMIGLSGTANAGKLVEGDVPHMPWAQHCIEAEANGTLGLLKDYNRCTSKGYGGAMNLLDQYSFKVGEQYYFDDLIQSVHVVVTDITRDFDIPYSLQGICTDLSKTCYRAIIYINGDGNVGGQHVATFVTTPGDIWYKYQDDPLTTEDDLRRETKDINQAAMKLNEKTGEMEPIRTGGYTVESGKDKRKWVGNRTPEPNMYYKAHLVSDKMGLGGTQYNRFTSDKDGLPYYIMDHYVNSNNEDMAWAVFYNQGTAFHASPTVNGNVGSHGCTRLKYSESKIMNHLARHVGRQFTVETRNTELEELTQEEREAAAGTLAYTIKKLEYQADLQKKADAGDEGAKQKLLFDAINNGGLY